ncbi:hypothetical protein MTR67_002826 [Solanum verrucosum]|uniref:Uncharacterized protein n=1 Tax=Solanum verrucosum TaxID=315347 RepID=A0AAF0T8T7_SOLVR|nr:hypothetical protein MTR67_002826 [Solanum verrucosum]
MPSLQTALPRELANNAIGLYRECLRRAKYIGSKSGKRSAANGLINHMLHESEKMTGRKFSQNC